MPIYEYGDVVSVCVDWDGSTREVIVKSDIDNIITTIEGEVLDKDTVKTFVRTIPRDEVFLIEETKLLNRLPEELRSPLSYYAYQKGHTNGNNETLLVLGELVFHLEDGVKRLIERIEMESKRNN